MEQGKAAFDNKRIDHRHGDPQIPTIHGENDSDFTIEEELEDEFDRKNKLHREQVRKERYHGWSLVKHIPRGFINFLAPGRRKHDFKEDTICISRCKVQKWAKDTPGKIHEGRVRVSQFCISFLERGTRAKQMIDLHTLGGQAHPNDSYSTDSNLSFHIPYKDLFGMQRLIQQSDGTFEVTRDIDIHKADAVRLITVHLPEVIVFFGFPSRENFEEACHGIERSWMKLV